MGEFVSLVRRKNKQIDELEALVRSFVIDEIDYMDKNNLGDPEQKHNIKWARRLGITDGTV